VNKLEKAVSHDGERKAVSQGGRASTGNDGAGWWGDGAGGVNSKKQARAAATAVLRIATGDHKRGGTSAVNMSTATVGVTHQLMAKKRAE